MAQLSLSSILDDIRLAEEGMHKFEGRYWISSEQFFALYSHGLLDDGGNLKDFTEWAGYYKLRQKRQKALESISSQRMEMLRKTSEKHTIQLNPGEPKLETQ